MIVFRRCGLDVKGGTQEHFLVPPFNHAGFRKLSNSNKFKITWKGGALVRANECEIRGLTASAHDVSSMESSGKGNRCSSSGRNECRPGGLCIHARTPLSYLDIFITYAKRPLT